MNYVSIRAMNAVVCSQSPSHFYLYILIYIFGRATLEIHIHAQIRDC